MRKRSPAKSAASSPPVPARNSRIALFSSAASFGQKLHFELKLELGDLRLERAKLLLGERRHLRVGSRIVDELLQLVALAHRPAERGDGGDDGIELGELAREPHIALLIRARGERAFAPIANGQRACRAYRQGSSSSKFTWGQGLEGFRSTGRRAASAISITGRAAAALPAGGRSSCCADRRDRSCRLRARSPPSPAHRHIRAQAPRPHPRE